MASQTTDDPIERVDNVPKQNVIADVRDATDEEMERLGWDWKVQHNPVAIELASGDVLIPSQDPEMNGPGHVVGLDENDNVWEYRR